MTDIVYVLGTGSRIKNFEIRMSLRSIEKYLSNYDKVWVIGECPDFLQNVKHVPYPDKLSAPPDYNIMKKITRAIQEQELSADFLFVNDDHFLLSDFDANNFPYFYSGTLDNFVKKRGLDGYGKRANNTLKYLKENQFPDRYYDIHYPIRYNGVEFLRNVTNAVDWENSSGFIIKSLYANPVKVDNVIEEKDYKVTAPPPSSAKVFSTYPYLKAAIQRFLIEQFPDKSKFERVGL